MPEQDLDTRIRELVARAVADAPPAPEIDPGVIRLDEHRRDSRRAWWVGAGAALVAAAAAITTVVLINDTNDRISTPVTEPSTGSSVPTAPTTTSVPPAPSTSTILTAGPDGVVERRGDEVRTLTTEPTAIALAAPDGRILVQQPTDEGTDDAPLALDPTDGSTAELFGTADWDGLVRMHDVELVDGRQLLLFSLVHGADQPETDSETVFVVDLETEERTPVFNTDAQVTDRLTMATNGLVVGTVSDDAGVSLLALTVPGSPAEATPIPTAEQLGLQPAYPGCDVECPRMYAVAPDGQSFAWVEGFDDAELVVNEAGVVSRIPLPFPPQGSGLDVTADGSFLLSRSSPDVRAMRVGRDGTVTELDGTIATAGPGGSTDRPEAPAFEVTEAGFVASAGPNGVVLRTPAGAVARRLDQPATIALPVGDGRVVVQREGESPFVWWPDGRTEELFQNVSLIGPVTAQDVAVVDGRPLLLYVISGQQGVGFGRLNLDTNVSGQLTDLPAAPAAGHRLHLAANGLIVGHLESGFFVTALPGTPGEALAGQLTEQSLGSDPGSVPLLTVSPDGSWVAWLEGGELVEVDVTASGLGEPRRWALPFDTAGAVDLDVSADGVIVNFGSGQDARHARRDGSFGVLDGPMATHGPGTLEAPAPPETPATTPPTTTTAPPAPEPAATMVTADADGVAVVADGLEVRRLDEPAEVAFLTPGGAVIFQPARATPDAEPGDPLIWRPDGTVERLLGELPATEAYRLYDVANVAGVPTVLYGRRTRPENGDPAGHVEVLNALAMAPGNWATQELTEVNTWEGGFSGLSLSAEGIVLGTVGESVTSSLFAIALPGSPADGEGVPDAASLGLEPSYSDCTDCPGQYTISADGRTIAWLDSGEVVVFDVETGETRRFTLPELAGFPVRLDIRATGGGTYEAIVDMWSHTDGRPIHAARFQLAGGSATEGPLGADFASFAP